MSIAQEDFVVKFHQAIKNNHYDLVEELIKVVDINGLDAHKCPPLYYAMQNKQWKMVQLLIENGAKLNIDDKDEWHWHPRHTVPNIIHYAVEDLNVEKSFIDFLLSQPTINIEQQSTHLPHCTPILSAAKAGNLRLLKHLITKYQPNVHATCKYGHNLFYYAIRSIDECVIQLIQYIHSLGFDINVNDCYHYKPLKYAIEYRLPVEIIQQLIEYGAMFRINKKDKSPPPNLLSIIKRDENDYQLFKTIFPMVVKQFPNDDVKIKALLFEAVSDGNITVSKYIVENYRSELNDDIIKTTTRQNQYHCGGDDQHDKGNDLFIALGLNSFKPRYHDKLQFERFRNTLQLFEYLMENGIINGFFNFKIHCKNFDYHTLLLFLAQQPTTTLRLLQLCIENGADIHEVGVYGYNIIHLLCRVEEGTTSEDLITKIDYFIGLGVNVNAIGKQSFSTPLHCATANKIHSSQLVSHLIHKHRVDIHLCGRFHSNLFAFHYVHSFETVKAFVSKSNVNFQYHDGNTHLLILLTLADNFDKAKYGIDDYKSKRPLIPPIDDDYYKSVMYLLDECGANVNVMNWDGNTHLHIILHDEWFTRQPIEIIQRIIELQDPPYLNYCNYNRSNLSTPLELAINQYCQPPFNTQTQSKALQTIELLLQHNANPIVFINNNKNQPQQQQQTILHYTLKKQLKQHNYINNEDTNADDLETIINCCIDSIHIIPQ